MQEILFSAKRIDNGYTVCGYHVKDGVTGKHFIVAEGSMLHESDKVGEEGLLNFVAFEVDEDTISVTGDGWIPVEERLPEEKVSPVTRDFYEYQVTANFGFGEDVRTYKYGNGHWWHGPGIVDEYVIAWRQKPDPYRPERSRK